MNHGAEPRSGDKACDLDDDNRAAEKLIGITSGTARFHTPLCLRWEAR